VWLRSLCYFREFLVNVIELRTAPRQLAELAAPSVAAMAKLLRQTLGSCIQVETEIAPGLWPVRADPSQLEVAILNLAVNARDAMPEGGTVTIRSHNVVLEAITERVTGEYVCIAAEDSGEGIPPHVLARVLEPFFTTQGPGLGTGSACHRRTASPSKQAATSRSRANRGAARR